MRTTLLSICGTGDQDAHVDAALGRRAERVGERRPGNEVGGGELDRLRRRGDRQVVEGLGVRVADLGARAHDLHRAPVVDRLELGQVLVAGEHLAGALEPVLGERALEPAHDRAAHPHMGVAPVVGPVGVAHPLGGDPDPAGHPHLAVGDQDPAVGAVGDPLDRVRLRRAEEQHLGAGVAHLADQRALHLRGAERVEDHLAGDALARLLADRAGDPVGDLAAPVDVGLHVQRPLGRGDRLEEGGKDRVAVDQQLGAVAPVIGAPVSASAARRKSGERTSSSVPIS